MRIWTIVDSELMFLRMARLCGLTAGVVALVVTISWALSIEAAPHIASEWRPMKLNAAVAFIFGALALWTLTNPNAVLALRAPLWSQQRLQSCITGASIAIIGLVSLLTLTEYATGWNLGIDQWILSQDETTSWPYPGRIPPAAAILFVLLATAIWMLIKGTQRAQSAAQILAVVVAFSALVALLNGVAADEVHLKVWNLGAIPPHSAVLFLLLGIGLLLSRPKRGWMALVGHGQQATASVRRWLLPLLLIASVGGGMQLILAREGNYSSEIETSLIISASIAIILALTMIPARLLVRLFVTELQNAQARCEQQEAVAPHHTYLSWLNEVAQSIHASQDLLTLFPDIIARLEENLPASFVCVCVPDEANEKLTVRHVGPGSAAVVTKLALTQNASISIKPHVLKASASDSLIYEPDILNTPSHFLRQLTDAGLSSAVIAPIVGTHAVFAVLIAAREKKNGFSGSELECLRLLTEIAAHTVREAERYGALRRAYDNQAEARHRDLRQLGEQIERASHQRQLYNALRLAYDVQEQTYQELLASLRHERVNLTRIAEQAIELTQECWQALPKQFGIAIELRAQLDQSMPDTPGVENELRDVIADLVLGAVNAMPAGGVLTVRTRAYIESGAEQGGESSGHVCLEVSNTGDSLDQETQHNFPEAHFTTHPERCLGRRLAKVCCVTRRNGGEIDIHAAGKSGATVRLTFPMLQAGRANDAVMLAQTPW